MSDANLKTLAEMSDAEKQELLLLHYLGIPLECRHTVHHDWEPIPTDAVKTYIMLKIPGDEFRYVRRQN